MGVTDPDAFRALAAQAASQGITTSTIGIGLGYDDEILTELAIGGSGNHTFAAEADAAAAAVAGEIDGLLSKTVQAANLFIKPSAEVASIGILNDLPSLAVTGGVLVELGDCYSGEHRQLLFTVGVPALADLGLAQVATFELSYVSIPQLESHTVTLPVSVNVVPKDVAAGRVADPQVHRHRLLLHAQTAKRDSEQALRAGDFGTAQHTLRAARDSLASVPDGADGTLTEEITLLDEALDNIASREAASTSHFLSTSRAKRHRGYRSREQGGPARAADEES